MKVLQLNAYFSFFFIFWCFGVIFMAPYFYEILGSSVKFVQGFYLIVAFAVYRNIWAYKNKEYAIKCLPISICGFAAVSISQILACFYFASFLADYTDLRKNGVMALVTIIPTLPLGLFGFALSFYCNLKVRVPFIWYKRVEYFALFPIYAALALSLSSYILYFISYNKDVVYKHEIIAIHSAIVLASILIFVGFVSFKNEIFFAAFCSLSFAAFIYSKMAFEMGNKFIKAPRLSNFIAYYGYFHIITVLIFVFTGMLMCFYASKSSQSAEKSNPKHKIYVASNESLPFTVCQKC